MSLINGAYTKLWGALIASLHSQLTICIVAMASIKPVVDCMGWSPKAHKVIAGKDSTMRFSASFVEKTQSEMIL